MWGQMRLCRMAAMLQQVVEAIEAAQAVEVEEAAKVEQAVEVEQVVQVAQVGRKRTSREYSLRVVFVQVASSRNCS